MVVAKRIFSRTLTILLIISTMSAGLFGPAYLYLTTRADFSQIQLPGTPINETEFHSLVSENPDKAIFIGSYELESSKPYVLRFNPNMTDTITQDAAVNSSLEFIPTRYQNYLNFIHWAELNPDLPEWTIRFTSHRNEMSGYSGLVVVTGVNAVTGRLTQYHVHWDEQVDSGILSPPIQPDASPVNYSVVEAKLIQFLSDHAYALPATTRLLEAHAWPNETEADWYRFKLGIPTGNVTPDEAIQGIEARVDAVTGEILDFTYSNIEIPQISVEGVIDPDFVLDMIMENHSSKPDNADAEYIGAFLRLRLVETTSDIIRIQLVWTFRFKDEEGWFFEIHRDAYNGGKPILNRNVLYDLTEENNAAIIVIPLFAGAVASIIFLTLRRYTQRTIS